MAWCSDREKLDQDIFDALAEFFAQTLKRAEDLAGEHELPLFCMKALHQVTDSIAMKDLSKLMHCDPSFVTAIADTLEKRGLARREPNAADRRIKNLVLTPDGLKLKERLEQALLEAMPWRHALNVEERESFLALVRKMNSAGPCPSPTGSTRTGEVSATLSGASPSAN